MDDEEEEEIPVDINNDLERKIAEAFEVFDHAGNKTVEAREVGTIVRALGCCPTEAEVQEILVAIETPEKPGNVHLANFLPHIVELIKECKYQPATPEQLLAAFQVLDAERRGYLTIEQISTLMTQDGEPFTQDEIDEMLELAIDPNTQTIPYEYYINQLMYCPSPDEDTYLLADRVQAELPKLEVAPSRRFSKVMEEIRSKSVILSKTVMSSKGNIDSKVQLEP